MFEIITFGSSTWDIFLKIPENQLIKSQDFPSGAAVAFNLGSKIDLENMYFSFGGGGVNSAFTFLNQGFNVAYCGSVGKDIPGKEIVNLLKESGIGTDLIQEADSPTNNSVILNTSENERTVLAYRGASEMLDMEEVYWSHIDSPLWFYIAPLSGKLSKSTEEIINFAKKNKIKVAINLGNSQISLGKEKLTAILKKVDVVLLNLEEASLLTCINSNDEAGIMRELNNIHNGTNVVTKGDQGVLVSDKEILFDAFSCKVKVVDKTGAGDAFGAGFISGLIKSNYDIESGIRRGIANATSCIKVKGSINGLLKAEEIFTQMEEKIKIEKGKII
ncbi:MAG: carbohydrate kinase family protein [Candidatus Paceibacterota bacterium]|jgi:sugar/nucleoside kinase (ribokinase family)